MARDDRNRNRGRQGPPEKKITRVYADQVSIETLEHGSRVWSVLVTAEVTIGRGRGARPAEGETVQFTVDGAYVPSTAVSDSNGRAQLWVDIPFVEGVTASKIEALLPGTTCSAQCVAQLREALPKVEIKISPPGEPAQNVDGEWEIPLAANVAKDGNVFGGAEVVFCMGTEIVSETSTNSDGRTSTVIRIPTGTRRVSVESHVVGYPATDSVVVEIQPKTHKHSVVLNAGEPVLEHDGWVVMVTAVASRDGEPFEGKRISFLVDGLTRAWTGTNEHGRATGVVRTLSTSRRVVTIEAQLDGTTATDSVTVELPAPLPPKYPAVCTVKQVGGDSRERLILVHVATEDNIPVGGVRVRFLDAYVTALVEDKVTDEAGNAAARLLVPDNTETLVHILVEGLRGTKPAPILIVGHRTNDRMAVEPRELDAKRPSGRPSYRLGDIFRATWSDRRN